MQTFGAVASRSHPCRPVSASILIWLARFPTDFLVVGSHVCCGFVFLRRGFPIDFPVVGWAGGSQHFGNSRGFPTDFPVVGLIGEMVGPNRTSGSLPIADFTVILLDAALAVGKHVAWSGARLSTPCTQLAVNFELATEAINGEFVKG